MADDANPAQVDGTADDVALAHHATVLADGIETALGPWVLRMVTTVADRWRPGGAELVRDPAWVAARRATAEVGGRVRALLMTDPDQQRTGPLAVVREAVRYPTAVLAEAGVPPAERDEFAQRMFPEDIYDLAPASFADLHPDLLEPGVVWGAAKTHVVLQRRRTEGLR